MGYKRVILEQGDDPDQNEEYVPDRGEAFMIGMSESWSEVVRLIPFVLLILLALIIFVCTFTISKKIIFPVNTCTS